MMIHLDVMTYLDTMTYLDVMTHLDMMSHLDSMTLLEYYGTLWDEASDRRLERQKKCQAQEVPPSDKVCQSMTPNVLSCHLEEVPCTRVPPSNKVCHSMTLDASSWNLKELSCTEGATK